MLKKILNNKKIFNLLIVTIAILISLTIEFGFLLIKEKEIKSDKGEINITDKINYTQKKVKVAKEKEAKVDNISEIFNKTSEDDDLENDASKEEIIEYVEKEVTCAEIKLDKKYYIDKIRINYKTNKDVKIDFSYLLYNEYGDPYSASYYNLFEKEFNYLEKNIQKSTSKITFTFDESEANLSIQNILIINKASFNIMRFIFLLFINLLIALIIIFKDRFKSHIEILFAVIVMFAGSAIIVYTPTIMHTLWDDMVHFPNAYNLFSKEKVTTKSIDYALKGQYEYNNNSSSINEVFRMYDYLNENTYETISKEKKSTTFINYADYAYIPSAIVLKVCQILKIPFVPMYWMGKFINLIIYALMGYYTIKHAKIGKNILFVLFLIPTNLYLACQYSKDLYVTGLLMLGISTFANICVSKDKITLKEIMTFVLAILFGSLSKAIYIPFLFLILLIPSTKFKNKKQSLLVKLIVLCITAMVLSTFILPTVTSSSTEVISDTRGGANVSISRQMKLIFEQPISFAKVFRDNFFDNYFISYILSRYSYMDFNHFGVGSSNIYWLFIILMFFSILADSSSKEKLPGKVRISMLLISVLVMCFIMMSMYLTFNNVGSTYIRGVQYRYYLPLLLPILLVLHTDKLKNSFDLKKSNCVIVILMSFILFNVIYELLLLPLWI